MLIGTIKTASLNTIKQLNEYINTNIPKEIQLYGINTDSLLSSLGDYYHCTVFSLQDEGYNFLGNNKYRIGNDISDSFLMQDYDLLNGYFSELSLSESRDYDLINGHFSELSLSESRIVKYETDLQDLVTASYIQAFSSLTELGLHDYLLRLRKIRNDPIEEEYSQTYIAHNKILSNAVVVSLPDILNNTFHNADKL